MQQEQVSPSMAFRLILSAVLVAVAQGAAVRPAAAAADSPTVMPATGGGGIPLINGGVVDPDAIGYDTAEFLISGEAHAYTTAAPLTPDGKWNAISADPNSAAAYTTRVIVYTPKKKFRGTVYVEWLNVSGTVDASPDWVQSHTEVARQRAAFVLVSAQQVGVNSLKFGGIVPGDPVRYASLNHPGDDYSYDIFSQAGQAVWDGSLFDGRVRRVIAMGQSQSAGRLATYIDAVHQLVDVYDGYIVHSRGGAGSSPLSSGVPTPVPTLLRDDLVLVIAFQAELDVSNSGLLLRQPETPDSNYRLWEVPGTGHFDHYGLNIGPVDLGSGQGEIDNLAAMRNPTSEPNPPGVPFAGFFLCAEGINTGPMHWVFNAAVRWIDRWVRSRGRRGPPIAPRLEAISSPGVSPVAFAVDEHGIALGGIRTPYVDAPIATLTGAGNGAAPGGPPFSSFCSAFGVTIPFTDEKLAELYPTHRSYVKAFGRATRDAVRSKFLLKPDARLLKRAAGMADIGSPSGAFLITRPSPGQRRSPRRERHAHEVGAEQAHARQRHPEVSEAAEQDGRIPHLHELANDDAHLDERDHDRARRDRGVRRE